MAEWIGTGMIRMLLASLGMVAGVAILLEREHRRGEAWCRRRTRESWERYEETGDPRQVEEWGMR